MFPISGAPVIRKLEVWVNERLFVFHRKDDMYEIGNMHCKRF